MNLSSAIIGGRKKIRSIHGLEVPAINFTSQQITFFLEVAKYKSFTKAAQALYLSQPAISKQIAALETELGIRLFDRSHSGITLTKGGEVMLDCFNRFLQDMNNSLRLAGLKGELTVGLLMGMDFRRVLDCVRRFRFEHPDINLDIYRGSSDKLREDVLSGSANAVILFDNHLDNAKDIEYSYLFTSRFVFVLSRMHPLADNKALTAEDISNYHFVFSNGGRTDDPNIFGHISSVSSALGIKREQVRFCRNFESIFAEVDVGYDISLLDESVTFLDNRFVTIPAGITHSVVIAWRRDCGGHPLESFVEYLKASAE